MAPETKNTQKNAPTHVAIIPDGNRRWAKNNNLPTLEGHRKGSKNFENLINASRKLGIKFFTGWAFSTENWNRSDEENNYLFNLARDFTKKYKRKFVKERIRFFHLGRKDRLPRDIVQTLKETEDETKDFTDFTVCMAMDYGGHDELIRAMKEIFMDIKSGKISIDELDSTVDKYEGKYPLYLPTKYLDTKGIVPPPDLIIRTSGEQRLSGFMSWMSAYSEFYFPKIHFPDFGPKELEKAIEDFCVRDRRFGGNSKASKGDY